MLGMRRGGMYGNMHLKNNARLVVEEG
jgi:hypothetical protein